MAMCTRCDVWYNPRCDPFAHKYGSTAASPGATAVSSAVSSLDIRKVWALVCRWPLSRPPVPAPLTPPSCPSLPVPLPISPSLRLSTSLYLAALPRVSPCPRCISPSHPESSSHVRKYTNTHAHTKLLACAAAGTWGETHTRLGSTVSGAMTTFAIAMALSAFGCCVCLCVFVP
jgi:hypothetical protein